MFTITLHLEPVPKGRPRFGNGRVYTPHETAQFETSVRWLLRQAHAPMLAGDLGVDILFRVTTQKADGDNYLKALLDAAQGILYGNDRRVRDVHYRLEAAAPGIDLKIWEL